MNFLVVHAVSKALTRCIGRAPLKWLRLTDWYANRQRTNGCMAVARGHPTWRESRRPYARKLRAFITSLLERIAGLTVPPPRRLRRGWLSQSQSFVPSQQTPIPSSRPHKIFERVCLQKRHCMHLWLPLPVVPLDLGRLGQDSCKMIALSKIGNRSEYMVWPAHSDASPFGTWTKTKHTDSFASSS